MHKQGGIVFYKTREPAELDKFYTGTIGATLWLDQGGCRIYKFGNMLFGFCNRDETETGALLTFCYPDRSEIDRIYSKISHLATTAPAENESYRIYHFYARDPEGRAIEFQYFWDKMEF